MHTCASSVLDEIDQRYAGLQLQAQAAGVAVSAPLLVLGTSERVGSNWLSDSLRPVMAQHNEPFRQQLGARHPLSPVNPHAVDVQDVSMAALGQLGWHGLVEFVIAKYSPRRQLLKETNLFFASRSLLRLFPGAPIVVLTRSPLGIASSFQRSGLFGRWHYSDRYRQMHQMAAAHQHAALAGLVPDDDPDELTALTRLIVLNTVLLADAIAGRAHTQISYEARILDPAATWASLTGLLPEPGPLDALTAAPAASAGDDVFATTNHKTSLAAGLGEHEAARIVVCTADTLAAATRRMPAAVLELAGRWLAGAERYQLHDPVTPTRRRPVQAPAAPVPDVKYVQRYGLTWRNLLVSNAEFCRMLNALHTAGVPNTQNGSHLLLVEMPHERGGRIHWSQETATWTVSSGYASHPVYWVTWLGAAAFAAINAARLPTHADLCQLAADAEPSNHDYTVGDVIPVVEPSARHDIHHPVGNLQVWCADGPATRFDQPVERWLHGAAWNTTATLDEINRLRSRHLLGASRGVGIRLVRDTTPPQPVPAIADVAALLTAWIDGLADRGRTLGELDAAIVTALQPDVALRTHI